MIALSGHPDNRRRTCVQTTRINIAPPAILCAIAPASITSQHRGGGRAELHRQRCCDVRYALSYESHSACSRRDLDARLLEEITQLGHGGAALTGLDFVVCEGPNHEQHSNGGGGAGNVDTEVKTEPKRS